MPESGGGDVQPVRRPSSMVSSLVCILYRISTALASGAELLLRGAGRH